MCLSCLFFLRVLYIMFVSLFLSIVLILNIYLSCPLFSYSLWFGLLSLFFLCSAVSFSVTLFYVKMSFLVLFGPFGCA